MHVPAFLEKLAAYIGREVAVIINSDREAETFSLKLRRAQEKLQDAWRQGVTNENHRDWPKELEDDICQADDALDSWNIMKLQLRMEQAEYEELSSAWEKVRFDFLSLSLCFERGFRKRKIILEMKALSPKLDEILKGGGTNPSASTRRDNSEEINEEEIAFYDPLNVIHRDEEESLVDMLGSMGAENGTQVIPIYGPVGVGKTALARLVYDNPGVSANFKTAWVSVPYPFDVSRTAKAILKALGENFRDDSPLQILGEKIRIFFSNNKSLVVLDNVWTEDYKVLERLKNILVGVPGCVILVTTRSEITAQMMSRTNMRRLSLLKDEECGQILNRMVLQEKEEELENLKKIGLDIAKKCNGLPLVAKTIGRLLISGSFTEQEWNEVLKSPLVKYKEVIDEFTGNFRLSYINLRTPLNHCFVSCVLCPRGLRLHADKLIRIWMAQGYISSSATWVDVQSDGNNYFRVLAMQSFFQELEREEFDEDNLSCKMLDLMHDFARYLSKSENYYFILDGRTDPQNNSSSQSSTDMLPLDLMGRIRNFCVRSVPREYLPPNFLRPLKRVRVLCLSDCDLKVLPSEVGNLVHLRYLDLSGNLMKELPETVSNLYNLQTLDLERCHFLGKLPHGMWKLKKLRHLLISDTDILVQFPQGLQHLTGLWTLHKFRASSDTVGYLGNLNDLRGYLKIEFESLNDAAEAEKANLREKNHIRELELLFFGDVSTDVIEAMQPPLQLKVLSITGMGNQGLPSWITALNSLKKLTISRFDGCFNLSDPALGKLPVLEKLYIKDMKFKGVTHRFLGIGNRNVVGGFPKLKTLEFASCRLWEQWDDVEEEVPGSVPIMPCLQVLAIRSCPVLNGLPRNLLRLATSLQHLDILDSECLESRYHASRVEADGHSGFQMSRITLHGHSGIRVSKITSSSRVWS